jgi:hypothetical protein
MGNPRYAVRKVGWHQPPHGDPYTRRVPAADPVASFDTFDGAESHRRQLEAEARAGENPFRFGGASVFFQSSLDGPRLHDWLMDEAIEPPASELRHSDWRAWWDAFAHTWTPHQLAHAWAAFDKVRFFKAAEEAPFTAHVTVEVLRERYERAPHAGVTRVRPVAVSRKVTAVVRSLPSLPRRWVGGTFEVVPVPSDVPPFAGVGYLVQSRVAVNPTHLGERDEPPRDARVPLALFATREAAADHLARLAAEAMRTANPFVFLTDTARVFELRDELVRVGMPLPLPDRARRLGWLTLRAERLVNLRAEWAEWYDLCQDDATDEQRAGVWELCDEPLFEAVRVEVSDD